MHQKMHHEIESILLMQSIKLIYYERLKFLQMFTPPRINIMEKLLEVSYFPKINIKNIIAGDMRNIKILQGTHCS